MAQITQPEELALARAYRNTFSSEEGREVFCHMMLELGFFEASASTPEDIALGNYARRLLHRVGILQDQNIRGIIDSLFKLPIEQPRGGTE